MPINKTLLKQDMAPLLKFADSVKKIKEFLDDMDLLTQEEDTLKQQVSTLKVNVTKQETSIAALTKSYETLKSDYDRKVLEASKDFEAQVQAIRSNLAKAEKDNQDQTARVLETKQALDKELSEAKVKNRLLVEEAVNEANLIIVEKRQETAVAEQKLADAKVAHEAFLKQVLPT